MLSQGLIWDNQPAKSGGWCTRGLLVIPFSPHCVSCQGRLFCCPLKPVFKVRGARLGGLGPPHNGRFTERSHHMHLVGPECRNTLLTRRRVMVDLEVSDSD